MNRDSADAYGRTIGVVWGLVFYVANSAGVAFWPSLLLGGAITLPMLAMTYMALREEAK